MDQTNIKSSWLSGCQELPQLGDRFTMLQPRDHPCNDQCPWLTENQGRSLTLWYDHEVPGIAMPEGEFEFAPWKRLEVWNADLRDGIAGYGSLCHVRLRGTCQRDDGTWEVVGRQCTGALVMQQRELLRHIEHGDSALSRHGAARVASEMLDRPVTDQQIGDIDCDRLLRKAHTALLDEHIGAPAVALPPTKDELAAWKCPERVRSAKRTG